MCVDVGDCSSMCVDVGDCPSMCERALKTLPCIIQLSVITSYSQYVHQT